MRFSGNGLIRQDLGSANKWGKQMCKWIMAACVALTCGPASGETLDTYLAREGSHAVIVLDLPFYLIENIISAELQDQYSGSKSDPTDALVDDKLTWSVQPSAIKLSQQGDCLNVRGSANGKVRVSGKINLVLGKVSASASADLRAEAFLQTCPQLRSDWSFDLGVTGKVNLTEADVYGISIRGLLQNDLDRAVREELELIASDLQEPSFLRDKVVKLWDSVCQLSFDANEIAVRPRTIAATQPVVLADRLRISLIISGDAVILQDPIEPCPALPTSLFLL